MEVMKSEKGELFFIICGSHMTHLTWKNLTLRGGHMGRLMVKHD